ncbi:MAG: MotA/TolQ/ExbB proton channel family protein [Planctomycetes bacterium]|nr:MotA/TolQ/ExbB proton channel family protein [Planctomycetota bacterium]
MTKRSQSVLFGLATFAVLAAVSSPAFGQEHGGGKTMMQLFEATGWVGWLMVITSVTGTIILIQNLLEMRMERLAPPGVTAQIEEAINSGDLDKALEVAMAEHCYFGQIMAGGLIMKEAGYEHVINGMEQVAAEETFKLNAKISNLSLIGNVAPLIGLLGTVTGMISSFQIIETKAAPTPADLAVGVYESLVNTTLGLFLAIVFLTCFFFMKNKVTMLSLNANLMAVEMLKNTRLYERDRH